MKKFSAVLAILMTLAFAWQAGAGPIPASPSPVPSLGESDLVSFPVPPGNVNVDWMVLDAFFLTGVSGTFAYLYQLENSSPVEGAHFNTFTVTMSTAGAASILGGGVLSGVDLDDAPFNHNIVGEEEGFVLTPTVGTVFSPDINNVTWTFANIELGQETDTLFFISTLPPVYGVGSILNSSPPSPWSSLAPGGNPVPIPAAVPEPGTALLLGLGIAGSYLVARRSKKI